jgi:hypothetical protein
MAGVSVLGVLMRNHFHLLVETTEANLSTGMKLLLGSFSLGWNLKVVETGSCVLRAIQIHPGRCVGQRSHIQNLFL